MALTGKINIIYQKYKFNRSDRMLNFAKDMFFCNGLTLVFKAYKRKYILAEELLSDKNTQHIYQPHQNSHTSRSFIQKLPRVEQSKRRFIRLLLAHYWKEWIVVGLLSLVLIVLVGAEPYLSAEILSLVKEKATGGWSFVKLILLLFVSKGVKSLTSVHLYYRQYKIGVNIYVNLSLAIHKESLRLQLNGEFDMNQKGRTLTLLEEDCTKLITFPYFLTQIVVSVIQIVYGFCYLTLKLPQCSFVLDYYILTTYFVICFSLGLLATSFAEIMLYKKDLRLALSIQGIKKTSFEDPSIQQARIQEIQSLASIFKLETAIRTLAFFYSAFFISTTLLWNYNSLSPQNLYMIILLYNQIGFPIAQLPSIVQNFNQLLANLDRVIRFLNKSAQDQHRQKYTSLSTNRKQLHQVRQYKRVGDVSWEAIKFYLSSGSIKVFIACIVFKVIFELCNIASSFLNKDLANGKQHSFIEFFNSFLPIVPFAVSLMLIFKFSLNVSRGIYSSVSIKADSQSKSVLMNLISNDLRLIDRVICINVFDCLTGLLSIIKSMSLSLYTIGIINKIYSLSFLPIILVLLGILVVINRCFMWTRRECTRLEAISKTPFIQYFYDSLQSSPRLNPPHLQTESYQSDRFSQLHRLLVQTGSISLRGIYYESWYQLLLILFSLIFITLIISISSVVVEDPAMIGLILSQILILDSIFQNFFISLVTFERNSIALQRFYNVLQPDEQKQQGIRVKVDTLTIQKS